MYSVNAINHNLANLQSELIISWLLKLHPNHFINDGCQLFIIGILVGVK